MPEPQGGKGVFSDMWVPNVMRDWAQFGCMRCD